MDRDVRDEQFWRDGGGFCWCWPRFNVYVPAGRHLRSDVRRPLEAEQAMIELPRCANHPKREATVHDVATDTWLCIDCAVPPERRAPAGPEPTHPKPAKRKRLEELDLAAVGPCPTCGKPVRRLGVPIAGSGYDLTFADRATCDECLQAKCVAAADPVRHKVAPGRKVILTP